MRKEEDPKVKQLSDDDLEKVQGGVEWVSLYMDSCTQCDGPPALDTTDRTWKRAGD